MSFSVVNPRIVDFQRDQQPSLGAALGAGLGRGATGAIKEQMDKSALDRALGTLKKDPSPEGALRATLTLPEEMREPFAKVYVPLAQQQQKAQISQKQNEALSRINQNFFPELANEQAEQPQQQIPTQEQIPQGVPFLPPEQRVQPQQEAPQQDMQQRGPEQPQYGEKDFLKDLQVLPAKQQQEILKNMIEKQKRQYEMEKDARIAEREEGKISLATNKDYLNKVKAVPANYGEQKRNLNRMRDLDKPGKINKAFAVKFSDWVGVRSILNADTQELEKLALSEQRRLKDIYGGRPTNLDVINFNKQIPSLYQSPEGRERIYAFKEYQNEVDKAGYDAYKEIMQGKKYPPLDIQEQVAERAADKVALAEANFHSKTDNEYALPGEIVEARVNQAEKNVAMAEEGVKKKPEDEIKKKREGYSDWLQRAQKEEPPIAGRNIVRTASRAAETIAGAPGDITEFADKMLTEKSALKKPIQYLSKVLPTTQNFRDFTNKITGGYTEPKSDLQEKSDEFFSAAASFLNPLDFVGKAKLAPKMIRAIGIASAGQLAKEGTALFTDNKTAQEYARAGVQFIASFVSPTRAQKFTNSLYSKAESQLPKKSSIPNSEVMRNIQKAEEKLSKGIKTPGAKEALERLDEFKPITKSGLVSVEDLIAEKKKLNEWYYRKSPPERKNLNVVKDVLHDAIAEYGSENKDWFKRYQAADAAHEVLQKSKQVSDWFVKIGKKIGLKGGVLTELGLASLHHGLAAPVTVAGGAAALKIGEGFYRFFKNKDFAKLYTKTLSSAIAENSQATIRNLQKLEQTAEKIKKAEKQKNKKGK